MCLLSLGFIYNAPTERVGECVSVCEKVINKKWNASRKHITDGEILQNWIFHVLFHHGNKSVMFTKKTVQRQENTTPHWGSTSTTAAFGATPEFDKTM